MENPLPAPVKAAFNWKGIVTFIVAFVVVNALLDVIGNFVPIVPSFIMKPVSTVKALIAAKNKPAA